MLVIDFPKQYKTINCKSTNKNSVCIKLYHTFHNSLEISFNTLIYSQNILFKVYMKKEIDCFILTIMLNMINIIIEVKYHLPWKSCRFKLSSSKLGQKLTSFTISIIGVRLNVIDFTFSPFSLQNGKKLLGNSDL